MRTTLLAEAALLSFGTRYRGIIRDPFMTTKARFQDAEAYQVLFRTMLDEEMLKIKHP